MTILTNGNTIKQLVDCLGLMLLAEKIIRTVGSKSGLVFRPLPQDDPTRRKPDITLAKEILDWEPVIPLDEGLRKTVDYFRDMKEN